ncbi:MAG TPA: pyruvate dehydrogenase complex E1 component subunit beta [Acidimicrobiales bacterium]|nr:pyruvate dehydrogenase complex E1 component subunit beta [Acidimicrobiales bacterium]
MTELIETGGVSTHAALGLSDFDVVAMYRTILLARAVDQKGWNLTRSGKARFVIPGSGQEAAQVGSAWALRKGHDVVLPYYRDVGVVLTMGMTAREVLLNVMARPDDPNSGGRQMPSHWGSKRLGIITGSSPIATQLPHAAGLARAAQIRGDDSVTVCYFGEATASKGDFHEALNYAGIHRLPLVLLCENNEYAISVPMTLQSAVANVADRAGAYGFGGVVVDGNDPLAVYESTKTAVELARRGGGPTLVECKTYRLLPHTSDDDDRAYRSAQEVEAWREKDPVTRTREYLLNNGLLTVDDDEQLCDEVQNEVNEAAKRAVDAAEAAPESAFTRVYARPIHPIPRAPVIAGATALLRPVPSDAGARPAVERSVLESVRHTLHELMAGDEQIVVLGEDVGRLGGVFRATEGLHARYGDKRVMDTPLAESAIVGIGIGLALAGYRPVVEIQFADFLHSAFDQIVSEAAKTHYRSNGDFHVPLVIRAPWGGGTHRAIYHSQAVEAWYAHVAGLKVVVPSVPSDVAGLLRSAVEDPDPVLFLEHKKTYRRVRGPVPEGDWRVPIGLADVVRAGDDLTIVTYGLHRHLCAEAVESLTDDGHSVELIDLRTISPLDRETVLESVVKTGRLLIVHEDNISFGVGGEVAAIVAEEAFYDLDAPVRRLAMADVPAMPYAIPMEKAVSIGVDEIRNAARSLLNE